MYEKILLAVDGSENAKRAAKHAIQMASLYPNASVKIIHVIDISKVKSEVLNPDLKAEREKKLKEVESAFKKAQVPYEIKIEHGEAGPTIVNYANNGQFDLVIVGSRGLNSLQEMVLGSVSHKVAKRVKCPVLIIK
ncbi:universal stress protein [Terrilactibacillus sp. BCM23-1]|uniref:Universal stress protein n=1 Tax=Terrilactibacillus tamarindi TaxID=2599694 RepID=A0A6N8CMJ6_9BACI|nr:universal stress protein [Terrilactibacillus tamarindi]MTT31141.1 universal stress protein [Terrilactibacillus tamarindi]